MRAVTILLVGLGVLFSASPTQAQATPTWLRVNRQVLADLDPTAGSSLDAATRHKQNRARSILAAGSGLLLSSVVALGYGLPHREPCSGSKEPRGKRAFAVAGAVGALGVAGVIGGASWLRVTSRDGSYAGRKQRLVAAGTGALSFVLSQALLGGLLFADMICSD